MTGYIRNKIKKSSQREGKAQCPPHSIRHWSYPPLVASVGFLISQLTYIGYSCRNFEYIYIVTFEADIVSLICYRDIASGVSQPCGYPCDTLLLKCAGTDGWWIITYVSLTLAYTRDTHTLDNQHRLRTWRSHCRVWYL